MKTTENVSEINSNINQRKTNSCLTQILTSVQNIFFFFTFFFLENVYNVIFHIYFPDERDTARTKLVQSLQTSAGSGKIRNQPTPCI